MVRIRMIVGAAIMVSVFLALQTVVEAENVLLRARNIPGDTRDMQLNTQMAMQSSSWTSVQTIPKVSDMSIVSEINMTIENSQVEEGVITITTTLNSGSAEIKCFAIPPGVKSIPPRVVAIVRKDAATGALLETVLEDKVFIFLGIQEFLDPFPARKMPEELVQIGSTWVREGTTSHPKGTLTYTKYFEVLGFKDYGPYRCAKIEVTTESEVVDSQIVEYIPGIGTVTRTMTAHITGSSIMYFAFEAIETGKLVGKPVFVQGNCETIFTMRTVDDTGEVAITDTTTNVITQFREVF